MIVASDFSHFLGLNKELIPSHKNVSFPYKSVYKILFWVNDPPSPPPDNKKGAALS